MANRIRIILKNTYVRLIFSVAFVLIGVVLSNLFPYNIIGLIFFWVGLISLILHFVVFMLFAWVINPIIYFISKRKKDD